MGIKKNLGGDRIGSGAKMDVELYTFNDSTFNTTEIVRTTQSAGTSVPIYKQLLLKGNTMELDLNAICFTNPTEGPCFGEYEVQIHAFTAPLRLYQGKLHMNMLEQGTKMEEIKFPRIEFKADKLNWRKPIDNQQINQSCIHAYLGTRGIGDVANPATHNTVTRLREATPYLMYWDIQGNYYVNQQEKVGYVIHDGEIIHTTRCLVRPNPTK